MTGGLRVLVAGAGGLLAHDLVPALRAAGHVVTALPRMDLDVRDPAQCVAAAAGHDIVVNAAQWRGADDAESMEAEAFAVNALGAANLARAAQHADARLVHFSVADVFDVWARETYAADALTAPRSALGRTKLAGEWAVRALHSDVWLIRTAWLFGGGGPNFVDTVRRLGGEGAPVSVVGEHVGQPTWTRDLADLVVRMIRQRAPVGIYHGTAAGQTTRLQLARAVLEELGLEPDRVRSTVSSDDPRSFSRATYAVLGHETLEAVGIAPIRDWRAGLAAYLTCGVT